MARSTSRCARLPTATGTSPASGSSSSHGSSRPSSTVVSDICNARPPSCSTASSEARVRGSSSRISVSVSA
ncbi:hypothetical protein ACIQGZ_10350 [Streptomyces sp. NPDC092296]|uniref:hypothetical protein n=1 Tax=Streptomyces sp. NPDC092296 TaxID=3366012 RepID=UPI003827B09A